MKRTLAYGLVASAIVTLACSGAGDGDSAEGDASDPGVTADDAESPGVKTEALRCDPKRCCKKVNEMWVCWPRPLPKR